MKKQTQRKDQTKTQRTMRDMGAIIISNLPAGASKRLALKDFWTRYPFGYKNFEAFRKGVASHPEI